MKTIAMTSRSLGAVRRLAPGLRGIALSGVSGAGTGAAGASVSMRAVSPRPPRSTAESWPPTRPVPDGRLAVAVVLGASGSAGELSFDAMLRDLAGHSDRATARVTAKSIEYPAEQLELAGAGWPWRPTARLALTVAAAIGVALLPVAATRRNRR